MVNFLLAIIIVMMLVIILLVKLMQLIMSFNPYYHAPAPMAPAIAPRRPARPGSGIATVIFVTLLVIALFWLTTPDLLRGNTGPEPQERELPMPQERDTFRSARQPAPLSARQLQPVPAEEEEEERFSGADVYHYNQRPSRDTLPRAFYAVQLESFDTRKNAARAAGFWKNSLPEERVVILYRPGPAPFKVIAGPFSGRDVADSFRKAHAPEGFVTLMDLDSH